MGGGFPFVTDRIHLSDVNSRALTHHFHHLSYHRSCCPIGAPVLVARLSLLSRPMIRAGGVGQAFEELTRDHTRGLMRTSSMEMLPASRTILSLPHLAGCKRTVWQLEKPSDTTSHGIIWMPSVQTPRKLQGSS
jgi:hypothetical protein